MPEPRPRRSHFGPVVLAGLASAGLSAVAATRPWVTVGGDRTTSGAVDGPLAAAASDPTTFPLASAVSLVVLAAWGVLLVTRGRVRRAFAVLALLASVGLVVTVVVAAVTLPGSAQEATEALTGVPAEASYTAWGYVAALAALLTVVPTVLAVRLVPRWPEMGSRYDAPADGPAARPAAGPAGPTDGAPTHERDLWRALDQGDDPTADDPGDSTGEPPRHPGP